MEYLDGKLAFNLSLLLCCGCDRISVDHSCYRYPLLHYTGRRGFGFNPLIVHVGVSLG